MGQKKQQMTAAELTFHRDISRRADAKPVVGSTRQTRQDFCSLLVISTNRILIILLIFNLLVLPVFHISVILCSEFYLFLLKWSLL